MKSKGMVLLLVAGLLVLGLAGASWADPCGTNGPLKVTPPNPPGTSFVQGTTHTASATFTVTSPEIQIKGNCDSSILYLAMAEASKTVMVMVKGQTISLSRFRCPMLHPEVALT
uniref:Uncharacterized protein n=1 Tax=Desulfobacca acetoxidans TaxID=60893 RepID=A0A7C3SJ59_9BACT